MSDALFIIFEQKLPLGGSASEMNNLIGKMSIWKSHICLANNHVDGTHVFVFGEKTLLLQVFLKIMRLDASAER